MTKSYSYQTAFENENRQFLIIWRSLSEILKLIELNLCSLKKFDLPLLKIINSYDHKYATRC